MKLPLPFGRQVLEVEVAQPRLVGVRRQAQSAPLADVPAAVREALEAPIDFPPLRRALTPDDHIAIYVDEGIPRLTQILTPLLEYLHTAHIAPEAITLLCHAHSANQPWVDGLPDQFQDVRI